MRTRLGSCLGSPAAIHTFIQQFDKSVWDAAAGPGVITLDDATFGVAERQQQLDHGLYASRWERAGNLGGWRRSR